jgi:hypothetical protein
MGPGATLLGSMEGTVSNSERDREDRGGMEVGGQVASGTMPSLPWLMARLDIGPDRYAHKSQTAVKPVAVK